MLIFQWRQTIVLTIFLIVATLTVLVATNLISSSYNAEAQQTASNHVLVGGGNNTYPFYGYSPQQIEIKVGSSVVWSTPTNVPLEPHTVTF
jgi:plastocyanin